MKEMESSQIHIPADHDTDPQFPYGLIGSMGMISASSKTWNIRNLWGPLEGKTLIIFPAFTPEGARAIIDNRRPPKPEFPSYDWCDHIVTFYGDEYARRTACDILELIHGPDEDGSRLVPLSSGDHLFYDQELRTRLLQSSHLVIIGSPKSNDLCAEAFDLAARSNITDRRTMFEDPKCLFGLDSKTRHFPIFSENHYTWDRDFGYAARLDNPWSPRTGKFVVVFAGFGSFGTRAAAAAFAIEEVVAAAIARSPDPLTAIECVVEVVSASGAGTPIGHSDAHRKVRLIEPGPPTKYYLNKKEIRRSFDRLQIVRDAEDGRLLYKFPPVVALSSRHKVILSTLVMLLIASLWCDTFFLHFLDISLPTLLGFTIGSLYLLIMSMGNLSWARQRGVANVNQTDSETR